MGHITARLKAILSTVVSSEPKAPPVATPLPARIRLYRCEAHAFLNRPAIDTIVEQLVERGFVDAGCFEVGELPELGLRLLVQAGEAIYAVITEHRTDGVSLEVVSLHEDGSLVTYSSRRTGQLASRPTHRRVYLPSYSPGALYARLRAERPPSALRAIGPELVASRYEREWVEERSWRAGRASDAPVARERVASPAVAQLSRREAAMRPFGRVLR